MGKKGVSLETSLPLGQAVDYLEDLVRSLRQGRVVVQKGKEYIQLTPAALVKIELEAVRKKDKEKFVLELSWRADQEAEQNAASVRIGSQPVAPVMAETLFFCRSSSLIASFQSAGGEKSSITAPSRVSASAWARASAG
jgi:amphi-Trp domain-containing protein